MTVRELREALEEFDDDLEVEVHNEYTAVSYMTDNVEYGHDGALEWVTINFSTAVDD